MGDLIDRDEAMNIFAVDLAEKDRQVSYHGFCIDAAMAIGSLPSAEKTGKWIEHEDDWIEDYYECSVCGQWGEKFWHYCPSCGAWMENEEHI